MKGASPFQHHHLHTSESTPSCDHPHHQLQKQNDHRLWVVSRLPANHSPGAVPNLSARLTSYLSHPSLGHRFSFYRNRVWSLSLTNCAWGWWKSSLESSGRCFLMLMKAFIDSWHIGNSLIKLFFKFWQKIEIVWCNLVVDVVALTLAKAINSRVLKVPLAMFFGFSLFGFNVTSVMTVLHDLTTWAQKGFIHNGASMM